MNENENLNGVKELKVNNKVKGGEDLYGNDIPKNLPNNYTGGGFGIILDKIRKNKKLVRIIKIILVVLLAEILFLTFYLGTNKRIFKGVSVCGIDLGGLTRMEAQEVLTNSLNAEINDKEITLYYEDFQRKISLSDVIQSVDYTKLARQAQRVGREGNLFERFSNVVKSQVYNTELELVYSVDITKLRTVIYEVKYQVDRDPQNAFFTKEHGKSFVITDEVIGRKMNVALSIDKVREIIEENRAAENDYKIELIVDETEPEITKDYYESFNCELASFTTEYRRSDEERMIKLEDAASKIDGYLLKQEEEFSFNTVIGETITKESSEEGTDDNDEVNVQLATTLYNAAILAGMKITDRTNCDSLPSYIEIGRDALVYGKQVDLKFVNTTTNPIYIESYTYNGKLLVRIYGSENFKIYDSVTFKHNIFKVVPSSEVIEEYDERIDKGDKITTQIGKSGCSASLTVTYKVLGQKDRVVTLPESTYLPTPTRIAVGEKDDIEDTEKEDDENDADVSDDVYEEDKPTDGKIEIGKN